MELKNYIISSVYRFSNNLLEIYILRIANKLWAICRCLAIKKIDLLHIIEILRRKTFALRYFLM